MTGKKHVVWMALLVVVVALAGCAGATPTAAPQPPAAQAPAVPVAAAPTQAPAAAPAAPAAKAGGTVVLGVKQEPDRFWHPFTGLTVSDELGTAMNLPLIAIDNKLQFVPRLVTEVPTVENGDISKDGLSITFKLRPGVKWHDGQVFSSKDVKFTWQTIMLPGTDVRGRVGWDQITDIETPDANTAIFKFKTVDAGFLARLSLVQILPEHILAGKTAEQLNKDPWFRAPIGTGPFKFKEWVAGDHITLVKNPDYFEAGKPILDTIIWKVIPDSNVVLNQLQTGDIDIALRVSNTDAATMDTFQNVTRVSSSSVTPWLIWLNNTVPGLDDKAVRQALFYGTDREGMAKNLLKGLVQPADSLIPPYSWAYSSDVTTYKYNPEKAKQILDAAGWKPGADGIRQKGNVKLSFKISNIPGEQERVQVLSTAAAQWKQIGIDAQIDSVDVAAMWGNLLPKRTYQIAYSYTGRTADPDISDMYFCPSNNPSTNFAGYCNADVDKALKTELATFDTTQRKAALGQAMKIASDDAPYLYLFWRADHTGVNKRVQGYLPCPGYIELWNAQDWSVK